MAGKVYPDTHTGITAELVRKSRRHTFVPSVTTVENVETIAASGSALTLADVDTATMHKVTLTANCAITGPTPIAGGSFTLWLIQDGSGLRVPTFGTTFKFAAGAAPTWSKSSGARDIVAFGCVDGAHWDDLGYRLDVR